jgi:hypothetical protein
VKWLPACEDVSLEAEERSLLEGVTQQSSAVQTGNTSLCVMVICKVRATACMLKVSNISDYQSKPRLQPLLSRDNTYMGLPFHKVDFSR